MTFQLVIKSGLGKEIFLDNLVFTINSVKDRRIEKVTMKINQEEDKEKD